jgi:hypothetical protein
MELRDGRLSICHPLQMPVNRIGIPQKLASTIDWRRKHTGLHATRQGFPADAQKIAHLAGGQALHDAAVLLGPALQCPQVGVMVAAVRSQTSQHQSDEPPPALLTAAK